MLDCLRDGATHSNLPVLKFCHHDSDLMICVSVKVFSHLHLLIDSIVSFVHSFDEMARWKERRDKCLAWCFEPRDGDDSDSDVEMEQRGQEGAPQGGPVGEAQGGPPDGPQAGPAEGPQAGSVGSPAGGSSGGGPDMRPEVKPDVSCKDCLPKSIACWVLLYFGIVTAITLGCLRVFKCSPDMTRETWMGWLCADVLHQPLNIDG